MGNYSYLAILVAVLLISPFVIGLAMRQDKKTKQNLKSAFLAFLFLQLILGFFNWETFSGAGRSGYALATQYPGSFLWLFFLITSVQIILLLIPKRVAYVSAVVLNFVNTVIFFASVILVSGLVGRQIVSYFNIAAVFAVLIGNVVGLVFINEDKNLIAKFPWSQEAVEKARREGVRQSKFQKTATWVVFAAIIVFILTMLWLALFD